MGHMGRSIIDPGSQPLDDRSFAVNAKGLRKLPPQQTHLTSSSELPTYTVAGRQPHDAAPEPLCGSFPTPRQGTPLDSLRVSACPLRKNLGTSPAFAIGTTAVEKKPKANRRTRERSNAPGPLNGPYCCSQKREFSFAIFCEAAYLSDLWDDLQS